MKGEETDRDATGALEDALRMLAPRARPLLVARCGTPRMPFFSAKGHVSRGPSRAPLRVFHRAIPGPRGTDPHRHRTGCRTG